jgi:nucleoporin SEH1
MYMKRGNDSYERVGDFLDSHTGTVHDVAWAPMAGRSFHWVASASKDGTIRIWKVKILNVFTSEIYDTPEIELSSKMDLHSQVWRVKWNILGTCLSSSQDDGTVNVWKRDIKKKDRFVSIAEIEPKQQ